MKYSSCVLRRAPLSELCGGLRRLLAALQSAGYLASFKLDDTDVDDALWRRADDLKAEWRRAAEVAANRAEAQHQASVSRATRLGVALGCSVR